MYCKNPCVCWIFSFALMCEIWNLRNLILRESVNLINDKWNPENCFTAGFLVSVSVSSALLQCFSTFLVFSTSTSPALRLKCSNTKPEICSCIHHIMLNIVCHYYWYLTSLKKTAEYIYINSANGIKRDKLKRQIYL